MAKVNKKQIKKNKKRIKYKNVFGFIFCIIIFMLACMKICSIHTKNIYIKGNKFLTDQEVIDIALLDDYPTIVSVSNHSIEKSLTNSVFIKEAKVRRRKFLREINIEIVENKPVIYYDYDSKVLLADGRSVEGIYNVPTLINQTPEDKLKKLLIKLDALDVDVLGRISEIKYSPTNVDEDLFFLTMNDSNYVYINFNTFKKLDNYIDILKSFDNQKGILHLDSGDYLEKF